MSTRPSQSTWYCVKSPWNTRCRIRAGHALMAVSGCAREAAHCPPHWTTLGRLASEGEHSSGIVAIAFWPSRCCPRTRWLLAPTLLVALCGPDADRGRRPDGVACRTDPTTCRPWRRLRRPGGYWLIGCRAPGLAGSPLPAPAGRVMVGRHAKPQGGTPMSVAQISPSASHIRSPEFPSGPRPALQVVSSAGPPPRLLDRVRQALQARHYSRRTEKAYVGWIRRYILKSISLCTSSLSARNREGAVIPRISPRAASTYVAVL